MLVLYLGHKRKLYAAHHKKAFRTYINFTFRMCIRDLPLKMITIVMENQLICTE